MVGYTFSTSFPTTAGAFDPVKDAPDRSAFVFRMSPTGSQLEYSTFLEGIDKGSVFLRLMYASILYSSLYGELLARRWPAPFHIRAHVY